MFRLPSRSVLPALLSAALGLPGAALADRIEAAARVDRVTVFPDAAQVERVLRVDLPAGRHQLVVGNLPPDLSPEAVQVRAVSGVTLGAMALLTDRLPAVTPPDTGPVADATRAVTAAEAALAEAQAVASLHQQRAAAARDRIAVMGRVAPALAEGKPVDDLPRLSALIATETARALDDSAFAEADARRALADVAPRQAALDRARADLAAVAASDEGRSVLDLSVVADGGPAEVVITTHGAEATWAPVYDLHLSTEGAGGLIVDRLLAVTQDSAEDWSDVALVLSTADALGQTEPSRLWPRLMRAEDPEPVADAMADGMVLISEEPAPVVAGAVAARVDLAGQTVLYSYPERVSLRRGQNALYLPLDRRPMAADIFVLATPQTAEAGFIMARVTNTLAEPLLPGSARLFRDGTLVGLGDLQSLAPGAEAEIGFGPLPAFRLSDTRPDRNEGETGLLTTSNDRRETVTLRAENGTGREWPVELRAAFAYSEQDILTIRHEMAPPPDAPAADAEKGVHLWRRTMAPGAALEIRVDTRITWPEGKELR